jgi:hypothetical protein
MPASRQIGALFRPGSSNCAPNSVASPHLFMVRIPREVEMIEERSGEKRRSSPLALFPYLPTGTCISVTHSSGGIVSPHLT